MSAPAGDFTCADLVVVQVELEQIWANSAVTKQYAAKVDALTTLIANQTAQFPQLSTEKDNQVKIVWLSDCSSGVESCTDDCQVGGAEIEADCKTVELDICFTTGFTVAEKKTRDGIFSKEQIVAKALLNHMKTMDEELVQRVIAALDTYAGTNKFLGAFTTSSGDTVIPAAYWNPSLFAYLAQASIMNRYNSPYVLSGSNLYQSAWVADMNSGNADGKGNAAMMGSLPKFFDLFNIDSVLGTAKTFLIDRGAVAFKSKAYYSTTPVEYLGAGQKRYSVASKNIPGVSYDVVYTTRCENNEIYHDFSLYVKAGFFQNPIGCDGDITGVLSFVCA